MLGNIVGADLVISEAEWIRDRVRAAKERDPSASLQILPVESLAGVSIIDELTFDVELIRPDPEFHGLISHPVAYVLKESNVLEWPVSWTNDVFPNVILEDLTSLIPGRPLDQHELPVGAGPFRLAYYFPEEYPGRCAIAPNEHYWDGGPQLSGVTFVSPGGPIGQTVEQAFMAGEIDYVLPPAGKLGTGLTPSAKIEKTQRPPTSRFLALNPSHPPFDDVRIRRALLSSNDLDEVYAPLEVLWENTIVPPRLVPEYEHCDRSHYVRDSHRETAESSEYFEDLGDLTGEFWWMGKDYLTDRVETLLDQWYRSVGYRSEIRDMAADDNEE